MFFVILILESNSSLRGGKMMKKILVTLLYLPKRFWLALLLFKYENFGDKDNKWYETYVDWCFHTKSPNLIYCSYNKNNKKDEALDRFITRVSS
jgi:hypothetical protein